MGTTFGDESRVEATGGGLYRGHIDPCWNLRPLPQGGIVAAIALRAMAAELDHPEQRLRLLHTTFVGQVADGPVEVEVEVLRRGRSVSQVRAEARNPGSTRGHITTAVFGGPRRGYDFTDLRPPIVPPPAECPSFRDERPPEAEPFESMPFWETRMEGRPALGHAPWDDYVPDRAERASWYRLDCSAELDDGTLDPLALPVPADMMPGAVGEKLGNDERDWFAPSIDLTLHVLDEWRSPWLLAHNQARHAGDGYASADASLWDCGPDGTGSPRLVAYATQLFLFSFPTP